MLHAVFVQSIIQSYCLALKSVNKYDNPEFTKVQCDTSELDFLAYCMLSVKHGARLTQEECEKPKLLYLRVIYSSFSHSCPTVSKRNAFLIVKL